jgi:hypothetical protein
VSLSKLPDAKDLWDKTLVDCQKLAEWLLYVEAHLGEILKGIPASFPSLSGVVGMERMVS